MTPQCRKLCPTTGGLSRTIFIHSTNLNSATPQKDRPQMMGGVERRKKPLNAKEAPSLRGDHRRHSADGKCAPFIICSLDFLLTFSSRKK